MAQAGHGPVRSPGATGTTVTTRTHLSPPLPIPSRDETITLFDPTPTRRAVAMCRPHREGCSSPTSAAGRPDRTLPLVVFAHGWNNNPAVYETLLDTWAAAGYLVAAPVFPNSANTLPGSPVSNYPEQALDLSFVITSLLGGRAVPLIRLVSPSPAIPMGVPTWPCWPSTPPTPIPG